ncbi:hypothetical protein XBLMG947_1788 [Xanthomonas bromi]|uniref:Uncharacterized protein n=1 Tax=Xanthomonas bromi TaxID=56449 RepID=A0A1C3NKT7_9XANT|nr:hypothetical protein XBLMG947_1788 [Xanthomonas bromi]
MQFARTRWFSDICRQGIKQLLEDERIVPVGAGEAHRQRHAVTLVASKPARL